MAKPASGKERRRGGAGARAGRKAGAETASRKTKDQEGGETTARKIWLAGLGAYGKSLEDAHEHIDKASQDASRFFHDLVDKGQTIEEQGREAIRGRISEAREKISGARERISEAAGANTPSVEDMIGRVRQRLGFGDDPVQGRLDNLAKQVNSLARAVSGLTRRRSAAKATGDAEKEGRSGGAGAAERAATKPSRGAVRKARARAKPQAGAEQTTDAGRSEGVTRPREAGAPRRGSR